MSLGDFFCDIPHLTTSDNKSREGIWIGSLRRLRNLRGFFGKFKVGGYLSLTSLLSLISFLESCFATLLINSPFLSFLPTLHYCIEVDLE